MHQGVGAARVLVHQAAHQLEHLCVIGQVGGDELARPACRTRPVDRQHVPPGRDQVRHDGAAQLSRRTRHSHPARHERVSGVRMTGEEPGIGVMTSLDFVWTGR